MEKKTVKAVELIQTIIFILIIIFIFLPAGYNANAQLPPPPPAPEITVTDSAPPSYDMSIVFDAVVAGGSAEKTVTITNDGNTDLYIGAVASADPLSPPFSLTDDNCSNQNIPPFSSCNIVVGFSPVSPGSFSDTFDIPSNDGDENPVTVTLGAAGALPVYNYPPTVPELVYPSDGQTGLATSIEFRWKRCSDQDSDPVKYSLIISENPDFNGASPILVSSAAISGSHYVKAGAGIMLLGTALSGRVRKKRMALALIVIMMVVQMFSYSCGGGGGSGGSGNPAASGNEVAFKVSGLVSGTRYYWKVAVDDGKGGVAESNKRSFVTQ